MYFTYWVGTYHCAAQVVCTPVWAYVCVVCVPVCVWCVCFVCVPVCACLYVCACVYGVCDTAFKAFPSGGAL